MKFTTDDIQHIADLARLELTPAELASYGRELSAITAYIDQLQTVAISDVANDRVVSNVWRADEVKSWPEEETARALAQADREDGLLKVKRVL